MSLFTDLLDQPFEKRRYIVIVDPLDATAKVAATDISVTGGNTFNSGAAAFPFAAGDTVEVIGSTNSANVGRFVVDSGASSSAFSVVGGGLTNESTGSRFGLRKRTRIFMSDAKFVTPGSVTIPSRFPTVPAHQYFEARIQKALQFERSMVNGGAIGGRSIPGFGTVEVVNMDGYLDAYKDFDFTKAPIWVLLGGDGFTFDEYGLLLAGVVDTVALTAEAMVLNVQDLQALFEAEIQSNRFLATGGLQGGSDLLNVPMPISHGFLRNIEPVFIGIDDGKFKYRYHDGEVAAYSALWHKVYDQGVPLTYNAGTPGANEWKIDETTGTLILGGWKVGPITMDTIGDPATGDYGTAQAGGASTITLRASASATNSKYATLYVYIISGTGSGQTRLISGYVGATRVATVSAAWSTNPDSTSVYLIGGSVGSMINRLVTTRPANAPVLTTAAIDAAALAAFEASTIGGYAIGAMYGGVYLPEGGAIADVLDLLINSVWGHYGFTRSGVFQVGRVTEPAASTVMDITEHEIISLMKESSGRPIRRVIGRYQRNWRQQGGGELAAAVADNVVSNGDMADATGWTQGTGWSIGAGVATASAGSASDLSRTISMIAASKYIMTVDVTRSAGTIQMKVGTTSVGSAISASGSYRFEFTAGAETTFVASKDSSFAGTVDNVSIRPAYYEFATKEWREVRYENTAVFSTAEDAIDMVLDKKEHAQAVVDYMGGVREVPRDIYSALCKVKPLSLDVAETLSLRFPRWSLNPAKNFLSLSIREDAANNEVTVVAWGPRSS